MKVINNLKYKLQKKYFGIQNIDLIKNLMIEFKQLNKLFKVPKNLKA